MNIFCFGISHQTANVEVRERFAIPDSALADSLMRLAQISSVDEGVLLSTCNRTEFYIVTPDLGKDRANFAYAPGSTAIHHRSHANIDVTRGQLSPARC